MSTTQAIGFARPRQCIDFSFQTTVNAGPSCPLLASVWPSTCQASSTQEEERWRYHAPIFTPIHTSCSNMFVITRSETMSIYMMMIMTGRFSQRWWGQWRRGERPYSGYTVHLCSSPCPRCFRRTSCLCVSARVSCIPDSAASHTGCCRWSIRSTRPSLHQLQQGDV